ncbi:Protein argonaute-2 [Dictyocoela muelleri]|nr:Protein argonaute-2 [Dictyocoela muelleri]
MELQNFPSKRQEMRVNGQQVNVKVNLLPMTGVGHLHMHHYAISIEPEVLPRSIEPIVMRMYESEKSGLFNNAIIGFDGRSMLVTNKKLAQEENVVELASGKDKVLKIRIVYKNTYSLEAIDQMVRSGQEDVVSTHIQCLELLLRSYHIMKHKVEGRKILSTNRIERMSKGLEVWNGLSQCIKYTKMGLCLNVDIAFSVFYEPQNLLDLLPKLQKRSRGRFEGGRPGGDRRGGGRGNYDDRRGGGYDEQFDINSLTPDFWDNLGRFMRGVKVTTTHRTEGKNFTFKVSDVTREGANELMFEAGEEKMSVAEYFAKAYKKLRYPHLPCVVIKKKGNNIFLPIEVIKILPGTKYPKKLDETQTSEMIKIAAKPPLMRFGNIKERLSELCVCENENMKTLGISIKKDFIDCKGIVMKPPTLSFAKNQTLVPSKGSWNLRNLSAFKSVKINNWGVIYMGFPSRAYEDEIRRAISSLLNVGRSFGVEMSDKYDVQPAQDDKSFKSLFEKCNYTFCIVFLQDKSSHVYQNIKNFCDTTANVVTQCITRQNIQKFRDPTFCSNIMLKINAKMGGTNCKFLRQKGFLDFTMEKPMIIFGADVTHPGVGDLSKNSIAAVVATTDATFTTYATELGIQDARVEIIANLDTYVRNLLVTFHKNTKCQPARIIFYRDGIGNSQLQEVYRNELKMIQAACHSLSKSYNPEIIFIIAQKRHSIRFSTDGSGEYLKDDRAKPKGNVPPGTFVEDIGHPILSDFYLVAHHALQGTARPVRYQILYKNSKLTDSDIIELTHALSYLYARATKSVSVCTPIYYAHLAAARAKCHIGSDENGAPKLLPVSDNIKKNLYYV